MDISLLKRCVFVFNLTTAPSDDQTIVDRVIEPMWE